MVLIAAFFILFFILLFKVDFSNSNYNNSSNYNKKGQKGESQVSRVLSMVCIKYIDNLLVIDENNRSHQIDHIAIRKNGIFCIETKNYNGIIFGNENDANWVQCFNRGRKNYFYNPVKQNNSHIFHLKKILGNKYYIQSVVVFIKDNAYNIKLDNVIGLSDLDNYLINYNNNTNYSDEEINYIYQKLISSHKELSNDEHIKNIKNMRRDVKSGLCPRCNNKLVLRNGKYGDFFGCTNYPKCRFSTKKILN